MRMQLVPLPRMKPLHPSSLHILASAWPTDSLYASRPTLCTCMRIFNRSRGDTTVRDTAPATPPAQKAATTGCETRSRKATNLGAALEESQAMAASEGMSAAAAESAAGEGACSCGPRTADMAAE